MLISFYSKNSLTASTSKNRTSVINTQTSMTRQTIMHVYVYSTSFHFLLHFPNVARVQFEEELARCLCNSISFSFEYRQAMYSMLASPKVLQNGDVPVNAIYPPHAAVVIFTHLHRQIMHFFSSPTENSRINGIEHTATGNPMQLTTRSLN